MGDHALIVKVLLLLGSVCVRYHPRDLEYPQGSPGVHTPVDEVISGLAL